MIAALLLLAGAAAAQTRGGGLNGSVAFPSSTGSSTSATLRTV